MLDRFPKFKSELLTLSIKLDIGQNIQNLKKSEIRTKAQWQIIRVGVSNFIKFDLRYDPKEDLLLES